MPTLPPTCRRLLLLTALLRAVGAQPAAAAAPLAYHITCSPTHIPVGGLVQVTTQITNRAAVAIDYPEMFFDDSQTGIGLSRDGQEWQYPVSPLPCVPSGRIIHLEPGASASRKVLLCQRWPVPTSRKPVFDQPGTWYVRWSAEPFAYSGVVSCSNTVPITVVALPATERGAYDTWLALLASGQATDSFGTSSAAHELRGRYAATYFGRLSRWVVSYPPFADPPPALDDGPEPQPAPPPSDVARLTATFDRPSIPECGEVNITLRLRNDSRQPCLIRLVPPPPDDRWRWDRRLPPGYPADLALLFSTDGLSWWPAACWRGPAPDRPRLACDPPTTDLDLAPGEERSWRLSVLGGWLPADPPVVLPGGGQDRRTEFVADKPGSLSVRAMMARQHADGREGYLESAVATAVVTAAPAAEADALALWRAQPLGFAPILHGGQAEAGELAYIGRSEILRRFPRSMYTALVLRHWSGSTLRAALLIPPDDTRLWRQVPQTHTAPTSAAEVVADLARRGQVDLGVADDLALDRLKLAGGPRAVRDWMVAMADALDGYWAYRGEGWELRHMPPACRRRG
ncbi:MAG: hypothetical protein HZB16_22295 [Armatimonadetes bacterium]|nr:hypothetical protein [Armatimonadota bacterium]